MVFNPRHALLVAATAVVAACGQPRNRHTDVAKPAAAAPTADALLALDRQALEAYFQGNGEFFEGLGTCGEQDIGGQAIHATTVYVKDGDAWRWAFGFNSPS